MKTELKIKDKTSLTEGLKVAPFRKDIRVTSPHKHNSYFEIIYLTKGEGSHTIDTKEYKIKAPVLFTIRKEQVHFWDIKTEPEGFVLIIKKSFIDNCLDKDIKLLISELSAHNCLYEKNSSVAKFFNFLVEEYEHKTSFNKLIVEGLLKAILAKLLESVKSSKSKNSNNSVYQKFVELLTQESRLTNKVNSYAKLLNTTPQNLNTICRKEAGHSASEVLSEHIINESKRLLLYTDFTVGEIAEKVDFKDNSHFSKYFKRYVGTTPLEFRKDNN